MARLEDLTRGATVQGILPDRLVTIVDVKWHGSTVVEVIYRDASGRLGSDLLYRDRELTLEIVTQGTPFSSDGDGAQFRLASEARRLSLAYLFDPLLAVHTSIIARRRERLENRLREEKLLKRGAEVPVDVAPELPMLTPEEIEDLNLVAQSTREGSVLQKVVSKLDVMREQMGSDRVYDVSDECPACASQADRLEVVPLVRTASGRLMAPFKVSDMGSQLFP
ncbi:hypothetical protein [Nitrospira sp. Kam-Ns4a]